LVRSLGGVEHLRHTLVQPGNDLPEDQLLEVVRLAVDRERLA
jgi:hypothetical protein